MSVSPPSFDEIRALVADAPGPDQAARTAAAQRDAQLTKPPGALGRLDALALWLAAWQGRAEPAADRPRIAVFAGNHGVAARGVSPYPAAVTAQMVQNVIDGGAAVNKIAETVDADLRVYELDLDHPTADVMDAPAMTPAACGHAVAYGMMAVENGIDVLAVGELGIGNTTIAAALAAGLFGGDAADWVGPGTGACGAVLGAKHAAVDAALARHRASPDADDPLTTLASLGGLEFAAMFGAVLAARRARTPVLLDGFAATVAAAVAWRLDRRGLDHCQAAHLSAEPGHRRVLETLSMTPILDLGLRLGEASGAALAIPLLRAAAACNTGMATFASAGVSNARS